MRVAFFVIIYDYAYTVQKSFRLFAFSFKISPSCKINGTVDNKLKTLKRKRGKRC